MNDEERIGNGLVAKENFENLQKRVICSILVSKVRQTALMSGLSEGLILMQGATRKLIGINYLLTTKQI